MPAPIPWYQTPFFCALRPDQRSRLEQVIHRKRVEKGQVLFLEGEPCSGFFLVEAGAIRLWKGGAQGQETTVAVIQPGQSFAEAAMFGGGTYPVTAEALEAGSVVLMLKEAFLGALRADPELCIQVIEGLALRMRQLTQRLERLSAHGSGERLLLWLKEQARGQPSFRLPVTKKVLAGQLSMSAETLSRHLRALQEQGLIRVEGAKVTFLGH